MRVVLVVVFMVQIAFSAEYLVSISKNILIKNARDASVKSEKLVEALSKKDLKASRERFKESIVAWKKVQATYVAGDFDEMMIDIPRLFDIYHHGNEDIHAQLSRIFASDEALEFALFKNSHKSINALEFTLFAKETLTQREFQAAKIMAEAINTYISEIYEFYKANHQTFVGNEPKANSAILNALIDSSYKLKEWRVGDGGGFSKKYRKDADDSRNEYYLSKLSKEAVEAIITAHGQLMFDKEYQNFSTMVIQAGAEQELEIIREALRRSLMLLDLDSESFASNRALYESLERVHYGYYLSLITALQITSKIVDADGD